MASKSALLTFVSTAANVSSEPNTDAAVSTNVDLLPSPKSVTFSKGASSKLCYPYHSSTMNCLAFYEVPPDLGVAEVGCCLPRIELDPTRPQ